MSYLKQLHPIKLKSLQDAFPKNAPLQGYHQAKSTNISPRIEFTTVSRLFQSYFYHISTVFLPHFYRISTVFLLITTVFLPITSQSQPSQLEQYLKIAAENNPRVQSQFNEYMAALERVPQVKALPDPEVAFGYFISPVETRVGPQEMRFSAKQMFPWFGELKARGEQAALKAKAKFEAFQEARNKLNWQVQKTWYQIYELEQRIRITKDNIALLKSFRQLAETRFESGKESMVDVIRVKMKLEELQKQLDKLEDERKPYQRDFEQLLNQEIKELPKVPDTIQPQLLEKEKAALLDSIRQNNPEVKRLAKQSQAYEKGIEVAQKSGYPDFGLGLNYITTGERNVSDLQDNGKDAFFPQISVKLPLYRKQYRAQKEEARYRLEASRQQEQDLQNELAARFEEAYQEYRDARRRVELNRAQLVRTRQAIDILMADYSSGKEDFEEILRMQDKLLEYQLGLEEALVGQNIAVARVRYIAGNEVEMR